MGVSLTYHGIWKWVEVDGSLFQYYYWEDFNPTNNSRPSYWTSIEAYEQTGTFDLSWFQPWHEVGCWVWVLESDSESSVNFTLYGDFQRLKNWSWTTSWNYGWRDTISSNKTFAWYMYFGVDDDEIWDWYTTYRIRWRGTAWSDTIWPIYSNFTVTNLNIDSNLYEAWCLRVDWAHLYYTDWTHWDYWYLHRIAYDSSVYDYVGRDCAWSIWLKDTWWNDRKHIYYVTENWYKTRTYWFQEWYWWDVNVWSQYRWSIRVPTWDADRWYGHLCYVTATGQKLRVLNWPPN